MMRSSLLLIAGFALVLMAAGEADAKEPFGNYTTEDGVLSVALSADGEYIAAGGYYGKVYFFGKDSSTPLWNYTTEDTVYSVAISADGEYIAAGSTDDKVYLFDKDIPTTIDSITPSPARFDEEITFSGTGSDSDGTVVAYEWSSSIDGFLSDEEDFSITGFSVGNHTISFRVQDNDGEWSSWSTAELYIYPNAPPVGTIDSIEPSPAEKGDEVTFNGTGSDSDGTIVNYEWDFDGDGEFDWSSKDNGITTFIYNKEGTYTAVLRVTDNDDFTATDSRLITVNDDESLLPSVSMIPALISIGLIAIYRRK